MACPICNNRKAKRFCPARAETICSICCGTEREVTLDCPYDCPYLVSSRTYDFQRRVQDRKQLPFPDIQISSSFLAENQALLMKLGSAICLFARDHAPLVDSDVIECTKALAETHRTLESGLYYEQPPQSSVQRELYAHLAASLQEFEQERNQQQVVIGSKHHDTGQMFIFLTQLGSFRKNGRPKSRAYIDFLWSNFSTPDLQRRGSPIVLLE